jgi:hypothetical protein
MAVRGFITRMVTAPMNGGEPCIIDPSGFTSHYVWSDPYHICAWTRPEGRKDGFYFLEDKTGKAVPVGVNVMTLNGHNTFIPGTNNEWILNDTYPQGKGRMQELYLYHIPENRKIVLGTFHEPAEYAGEWRCDLHPKCTPDGKRVIFDSTHGGNGRQLYMLEIGDFIR